jgi:hypothetical protein
MTNPSEPFAVRAIEPRDLTWVREELTRNWGATQIGSLGKWYDADALPGFNATARAGIDRIGLATHTPLSPQPPEPAGCSRIHLTTTNDNLRALGFYQKRGWSIIAIHRGAMDKARIVKPNIPLIGMNGIPVHDEIELELRLTPRSPP